MELAVADISSRVSTQNANQGERGKLFEELLRLAYLFEAGQASPSQSVQNVTGSRPTGINASALVSGAISLAPQLVAAGKGLIAVAAGAGPLGWIVGGVALSVGAFFFWRDRRRRQWLASQGYFWWELESSGNVHPFIRQCFTSSYFPQFSRYWAGNELQVHLAPPSNSGPWTDLGLSGGLFGRDNVRKKVLAYAFLPLQRRGANHRQIGALHDASSIGFRDFAYCRPATSSVASIIHAQSFENAPAQFFAATLAPGDSSLFREIASQVGPKVRNLMVWSLEYANLVSDRLAILEDRGFPVRLYSPGDSDVTAYEHFAKSATLCAIAFWPGAASHGKTDLADYEQIWALGMPHSYRHNGRTHRIRTAAGVYLLCLSAAAAGVDLVIIEDFLAGRRDDIPVSIISAASSGSQASESGSNVVSSVPIYSGGISLPIATPPSAPDSQSPQSQFQSQPSRSSGMSERLIAMAAAFMGAILFLRRKRR